jgi:hypothetical protein
MTPEVGPARSPVFAGNLSEPRPYDFFNGEVVQLDGPLPELEGTSADSQAA